MLNRLCVLSVWPGSGTLLKEPHTSTRCLFEHLPRVWGRGGQLGVLGESPGRSAGRETTVPCVRWSVMVASVGSVQCSLPAGEARSAY